LIFGLKIISATNIKAAKEDADNDNNKKTVAVQADLKLINNEGRYNANIFLDRKIEDVTAGLRPEFSKTLYKIASSSEENALTIVNYILAMKTEINLSDNYRKDVIKLLYIFSKYNRNKQFKAIAREDIISFLDSFRRPEATDPLHKWIGTYNIYRIFLLRFFKWLYYPDIEPDKRPKPSLIENIPQLKRKEKSIYKPTDLWTAEDDLLFLKYCASKRNKCFHVMAYDTGCRPHELLKLRIKDIVFKNAGNRQYAEVLVNGKTGSRHIPLIDSIPYVKDYLDHEHPQPGNHNAIFLCATGKSLGRALKLGSINSVYDDYKKQVFPKLLDNPNVPPEDKQNIRELLKKPWNPYIRRHSALTHKSRILKEHTLRQFAGWTTNSNMPQKYIHYFGNESSESILEASGIITKDHNLSDVLRPKQCPNCNEPNKPDSKFCAKCRMVLTYDAYSETLESEKQKEDKLTVMDEKFNNMQGMLEKLVAGLVNATDQQKVNAVAESLFSSGALKVAAAQTNKRDS
jgi:integrase